MKPCASWKPDGPVAGDASQPRPAPRRAGGLALQVLPVRTRGAAQIGGGSRLERAGWRIHAASDGPQGLSLAAPHRADGALLPGATPLDRPLQVLLEVGFTGGRAGGRTPEQALEVARAVSTSGRLTLAGVEAFEGIISSNSLNGTIEATDRFLSDMRALVERVDQAGLFVRASRLIVSAGGSAFPDRVVAAFGRPWDLSRPVELVLRSGCYITHDAVHYQQLSPFGGRIPETGPLKEALEVWGVVLSLPEPGLALIGFGKRDVPYDLELPVPRMIKSGGGAPRPFQRAAVISGINDQHAYLRIEGPENLNVGDMVGCGISHPCTAFDKWRLIPLVDDSYRVIDAILTYF